MAMKLLQIKVEFLVDVVIDDENGQEETLKDELDVTAKGPYCQVNYSLLNTYVVKSETTLLNPQPKKEN